MSSLFDIVNRLMKSIEIAEEAVTENETLEYHQDVLEGLLTYYEGVITRSNSFLDRNKNRIFDDVLNLNTRGEVERAMMAYSKSYLLNLGLSLEATSELAQTLIQISKRYKLVPPKDWVDVAKFDTNVGRIKTKLKYVRATAEM